MKVPLYTMEGKTKKKIELPDRIFAAPVNEAVMHQALVRQMANARLGTHKTKTRGQVSGGGAKPWRQKGSGRARQGSIRAPQWKGGGIVFGPQPRDYRQKMPKKMRHLALRSGLTVKAQEGKVLVLEGLEVEEPKTKGMLALLENLKIDPDALILLPNKDVKVEKSANNIPGVKTLRVNYLNLRDLFGHEWLIMPLGALEVIEGLLG